MKLQITAQIGRNYAAFLRRHVPRAFNLLDGGKKRLPLGEMSIALVNDASMSELHREFMSIDGPTDVLTFSIDADARVAQSGRQVVVGFNPTGNYIWSPGAARNLADVKIQSSGALLWR